METIMMPGQSTRGERCEIGELTPEALVALLGRLHDERCTGMLRVGPGLDAGVIFFHDGTVTRCEWRTLWGEEALMAILGVARASFMLIRRGIPQPAANIGLTTPDLLQHCAAALAALARRSA